MPLAEHVAPPPPPPSGLPQGREGPGGNTTALHAAPSGEQREGPTQERGPSPGGTREGANRTPVAQERAVVADAKRQLQNPYDPRGPNTNTLVYKQGGLEPIPLPDMDNAFFMVTPLGTEILMRVVPRTRWPHGNGYMEQL